MNTPATGLKIGFPNWPTTARPKQMHEPHKTRKAIMKLHLILNIISVSGKPASFPTKTGWCLRCWGAWLQMYRWWSPVPLWTVAHQVSRWNQTQKLADIIGCRSQILPVSFPHPGPRWYHWGRESTFNRAILSINQPRHEYPVPVPLKNGSVLRNPLLCRVCDWKGPWTGTLVYI